MVRLYRGEDPYNVVMVDENYFNMSKSEINSLTLITTKEREKRVIRLVNLSDTKRNEPDSL